MVKKKKDIRHKKSKLKKKVSSSQKSLELSPQIKIMLLAVLLIYISIFFANKLALESSDLGRHIKNGEICLTDNTFFHKNYYSYTEPDFKTNTHHWGSGVIYYYLFQATGFTGLHLFNILLYLLAVLFVFLTSRELTSYKFAFFSVVICIPLFTNRVEIRPEVFSYTFMAFVFYMVVLFQKQKIKPRVLLLTSLLFVFWVNIHIFFVTGLFIIGVYWFVNLLKKKAQAKTMGLLLLLSILACFVSPYGYKAFIEPFIIFREYGYMVAENQSVLFMQNRFPDNPLYLYFQVIFAVVLIFLLLVAVRQARSIDLPLLFIFIFFSALAWKMIRGIAPFGFVAVVVFSVVLKTVLEQRRLQSYANKLIGLTYILLFLFLFFQKNPMFNPIKPYTGLGLFEESNHSAGFYKYAGIQGPIFNNYDIGSFLIFHLFPNERVFVDNRPEAYSVDFFREIYIKMQEDESVWATQLEKLDFNVIYFYRHDMTPWAQPFLIRRIDDPLWAPVYVDDFAIILLKRNIKNAPIIEKYELPASMFIVT